MTTLYQRLVFCFMERNEKKNLLNQSLLTFSIILGLITVFLPSNLWAVASLAAEDRIDEIPVETKDGKRNITVLRDAYNKRQFYYIPPEPRITEKNGEPEFHLIRFQYRDPENPEKEFEGGYLQFAASLSVDPGVIPQLISTISEKFGINKKKVRLSGLPVKSATVTLYTPDGNIIVTSSKGTGLAPTFSTQKMTFMMELPPIGADVYDELVKGNTGVPVSINFAYNGLTPKANVTVYVNYRQAHKHYSMDHKWAAKMDAGIWGSGSAKFNWKKVRDELKKRKILRIEATANDEVIKMEELLKVMKPLVKNILDEITKDFQPPKKINPAQAKDPELGGGFLSVGYSGALKDIKNVIKGEQDIQYNFRKVITSNTKTDGFIGIGSYSKEIRKKLVTIVPPGPWRKAFFVLPEVPVDEELGITQVDLQISLVKKNRVLESLAAIWRNSSNRWKGVGTIGSEDATGRNLLFFPLMSWTRDDPNMDSIQFKVKSTITQKRDLLKIKKLLEVKGERIQDILNQPIATVDSFLLDASGLPWKKLNKENGTVTQVKYLIKSGKRQISGTLKPKYVDGSWAPPNIKSWLIRKFDDPEAKPVVAQIFIKSSGKLIPWSANGQNLRNVVGGIEISLDEDDIPVSN